MTTTVEIIEDSLAPSGVRLTTFRLHYPRYVHAELMTHRVFSRNASSSRATSVTSHLKELKDWPVYPHRWGKNQAGMQPGEDVDAETAEKMHTIWTEMMDHCREGVQKLHNLGLHKQWANRPLEWFSWIDVVVTATDWDNFFALRCHPLAMDEIRILAEQMRDAMADNKPKERPYVPGDSFGWHLPFVTLGERLNHSSAPRLLAKLSAARCARVSYVLRDGTSSIEKDLELFERLAGADPMHASPMEHQAFAMSFPTKIRNFEGWTQHRHILEVVEGKA